MLGFVVLGTILGSIALVAAYLKGSPPIGSVLVFLIVAAAGFLALVGLVAWLGAVLPLAIALAVGLARGVPAPAVGTAALLVGMNLVMGPLGEELGWRGYLLPRLVPSVGLVGAALLVGIVWALWHLPLWAFDSPQAEIPFWLFAVTCVCFSLVMTALWHAGGGALGPMVLFHLLANVGVGWLFLSGDLNGADAYRAGLPVYVFAAVVAGVWLVGQPPAPSAMAATPTAAGQPGSADQFPVDSP